MQCNFAGKAQQVGMTLVILPSRNADGRHAVCINDLKLFLDHPGLDESCNLSADCKTGWHVTGCSKPFRSCEPIMYTCICRSFKSTQVATVFLALCLRISHTAGQGMCLERACSDRAYEERQSDLGNVTHMVLQTVRTQKHAGANNQSTKQIS